MGGENDKTLALTDTSLTEATVRQTATVTVILADDSENSVVIDEPVIDDGQRGAESNRIGGGG